MRTIRWASLTLFVLASSFCLAQTSVDGVVKTAAGAPVGGAQVSLFHSGASTPSQKAVADPQGRFRFTTVNGGDYVVKTEASGFFTREYELVLRPREPVSLAIELAPRPQSVRTWK